ncbi:MAG: hypothetical protein NTV93_00340 [Verrucomicrobia bacterium]|nr:hypothetical protein [Verrucomicrobiota bacterium]
MKKIISLIACALVFAAAPTFAAGKLQTLVYPTKDNPSFLIDVPADWKLTPAEEEGDYFHLGGPSGAVFSFRTLEGSEKALEDSMKHCLTRANEKFKDVELGDAQDWKPSGLTGFYAVGTAKEKDGNPVRIAFAWCALPDDKIAELWFITDLDDEAGMDQANKIVNSLKAP